MKKLSTTCAISGGGPAGIMAGYLLARQGVDVIVLEKWPDFFRDFRGDTIHPATMMLMDELGLLSEFLALPHDEAITLEADIRNDKFVISDFSHVKYAPTPFIAFMPQWDFLNFISGKAKEYSNFHLHMETEAADLIEENGRIVGMLAKNKEGTFQIKADLVLGADGRHSTVREKSGFKLSSEGAPIDVLWFRISRKESDPIPTLGRIDAGSFMIMIDRKTYWQCGYVIPKDGFDVMKDKGLEAFQKNIGDAAPFARERVIEIDSWEKVKLLRVTVDHLKKWYREGLLLIGDAAHAMSPIGGVGINLAIQDAVAVANILGPKLLKKKVTLDDLKRVQKRRQLPARLIQRAQVMIQKKIISPILASKDEIHPPLFLKLLKHYPYLRRYPARIIGMGFRPEHIWDEDKGIRK